jgi:hypothetical protein
MHITRENPSSIPTIKFVAQLYEMINQTEILSRAILAQKQDQTKLPPYFEANAMKMFQFLFKL